MKKKWLLGILTAGTLIGAGLVACGSGSVEAPGDLDEMYVDTFVENINGEVDKAIDACENDPMCASSLPSVNGGSSNDDKEDEKEDEKPESSSSVETPVESSSAEAPLPTPLSSSVVDVPPGAVPQSSSSVDIPPGAVSPVLSSSSVAVTPTPTPSSSSVAVTPTPTPSSSSVAVTPTPTPSSSSVAVTPSSSSVAPSSSSVAAGGESGAKEISGTAVSFTSGECGTASMAGNVRFTHGWQVESCTVTITINGTAQPAYDISNCNASPGTPFRVAAGDEVCLTITGATDGNFVITTW
ncbi:MAG: hypothetical protein UHC59_06310 [Fibrobacteraceae bacterium]|nr:hypothetical protein [Fibrobacteraceae bacterium]